VKRPTNSSRSAWVRGVQCRASERLAVSEKSKISLATWRTAAVFLTSVLLELRVFEDLDRPVDLGAKLIGRRPGPGPIRAGQRDQQQGEERERAGEKGHRWTS